MYINPAVDLVRGLTYSVVEHINPAVAHSENCGLSWRMVGEPERAWESILA
jgi:hypothetical protein